MVNSYDSMQGDPMDPGDHPNTNMPQATQHFAGDVLPIAGEKSMGGPYSKMGGVDPNAAGMATGKQSDPKVLSIGMPTLRNWADRMGKK